MTHEEVFLQDIVENQDDDTPRRIFADWLLDQEDPLSVSRGEFIHLQCDIAMLPSGAPRPQEMLRRERELHWQYGKKWTRLQHLGCVCWEYRRGFVEGVGMSVASFVHSALELLRIAPVRALKLYAAEGHMSALASCASLNRVRSLDLEKNNLGDADIIEISRSIYLNYLETLLLWNNRIGDAGIGSLVKAELPLLSRLDLSNNIVGNAGAVALAGSLLLGRLRLLDLTSNHIGDVGGIALANSMHITQLGWLDLTKNPIDGAQSVLRERLPGRVGVLN